MTESILGFIVLCFAVLIITMGKTGLIVTLCGLAALIAIVVTLIFIHPETI